MPLRIANSLFVGLIFRCSTHTYVHSFADTQCSCSTCMGHAKKILVEMSSDMLGYGACAAETELCFQRLILKG